MSDLKLTKRKGFNFFRSYYDVFNMLETDAEKLEFIEALLNKQFHGINPKGLKGMVNFGWVSQINSIDSQVKGWESKMKMQLIDTQQVEPLGKGGSKGVNLPPTLQGEGEGEGKGKGKEELTNKINFVDFWDLYNKKSGDKSKLKKKWDGFSLTIQTEIMEFIPKYTKHQPDDKYRLNPQTFFNQKKWLDEEINQASKKANRKFKMVPGRGLRYLDEKTGRYTIQG